MVYRPDAIDKMLVNEEQFRRGVFCSNGRGDLIQIGGRLTVHQYVALLSEVLLPFVEMHFPTQRVRFLHDNSPIHTARIVRDWFTAHPWIDPLPWPAKSPVSNPIENVWADMVNEMQKFHAQNADQVFNKAKEIWDRFALRPQYWLNISSLHDLSITSRY
jgi:transposase